MSLYHKAAGIDHLERLALGDSPVHRLHPGAKIISAFGYIAAVISFPGGNVSGLMPFLLYPAVLLPLSGTPASSLLARLPAALPFALMGGLGNLLILKEIVFYLGPFGVSAGMVSFISILIKTLLTVSAALLLIATTSFEDINRQLVQMGMPKILCLQFVMTWRYLTVLLGEAASMSTAYLLRSPNQRRIRMKDMGSFLGQLLLRSIDRAERVYQAMKCRGFDGTYRRAASPRWRATDFLYIAAVTALALGLRLFNASSFLGSLIYRAAAQMSG
jgi:cobalt/nickel transport system permease protein